LANVEHSQLTGASLHESKGVSSAAADTVAVATGGGSTVWEKITPDSLNSTLVDRTTLRTLVVQMTDVTLAQVVYAVIPFACTVTKVSSVISNAFATANCIVTVANNAGSSMGTITIATAGSAAGDIDTLSPSSNNTFTAGQTIRLTSDGGGTTATPCTFTIEYTLT
jgi:hypothetical protein